MNNSKARPGSRSGACATTPCGGQGHGHAPWPLEALLRPEGRQRNAPKHARKRLDLCHAGRCQGRRQAQAREGPCGGEHGCGREQGHRKDRGNAQDTRDGHQEVQQDRRQVPDARVEPREAAVLQTAQPEASHEGDPQASQVEQEGREEGARRAHALTRVMQYLQTFADNIEQDKGVPHN